MGRIILKQPDGKFCVFSTIVDNFIIENATPQDIINFYVEERTQEITNEVNKTCENLNNGTPDRRWGIDYEDAMETIEDRRTDQEWIEAAEAIINKAISEGRRSANINQRMYQKVFEHLINQGFTLHFDSSLLPVRVTW